MIDELLPPEVACAVAWADEPTSALYPEEAMDLGMAVESRRREFATGRSCARRALHKIGIAAGPIRRNATREPLWPPGIVGSITHCPGYRAAAVARQQAILSIGIDAEIHDALPDGVLDLVVSYERSWLDRAPAGIHWDRVLFCAKESVYKAWFPITGRWLGFEDVVVTFDPDVGMFEARLLVPPVQLPFGSLTRFIGRYGVKKALVATTVVVSSETW